MQHETKREWLSDREVALRYSVSRITVWRWARAGTIPKPHRIAAGTTRWSASEIEAHDASLMGDS
jgi:predicted DNA-binding transcriptional regulator AlpA